MFAAPISFARELVEESRAFVAAEVERLKIQDELGFVLLHDCNPTLLLTMTWRNVNEIWESAHAKDIAQAAGYEPIPYDTIIEERSACGNSAPLARASGVGALPVVETR